MDLTRIFSDSEKLKKQTVDGSTKSRTNDIVFELVINFNLMVANKMHMRLQCPFPVYFLFELFVAEWRRVGWSVGDITFPRIPINMFWREHNNSRALVILLNMISFENTWIVYAAVTNARTLDQMQKKANCTICMKPKCTNYRKYKWKWHFCRMNSRLQFVQFTSFEICLLLLFVVCYYLFHTNSCQSPYKPYILHWPDKHKLHLNACYWGR